MSNNNKLIVQSSNSELTKAAHTLKTILGIKASRAAQRHASAMGYPSANHLIVAVKADSVEQDFDTYINILKSELMSNHQIELNDAMIGGLRESLTV
jgi:hypothetical protein